MVNRLQPPPLPDWLSRMVPRDRYLVQLKDARMHVMESGQGFPVLMLHGNPTWGFLYRRVAQALAGDPVSAIMPDLIGMGFSDKPRDWGRSHPRVPCGQDRRAHRSAGSQAADIGRPGLGRSDRSARIGGAAGASRRTRRAKLGDRAAACRLSANALPPLREASNRQRHRLPLAGVSAEHDFRRSRRQAQHSRRRCPCLPLPSPRPEKQRGALSSAGWSRIRRSTRRSRRYAVARTSSTFSGPCEMGGGDRDPSLAACAPGWRS